MPNTPPLSASARISASKVLRGRSTSAAAAAVGDGGRRAARGDAFGAGALAGMAEVEQDLRCGSIRAITSRPKSERPALAALEAAVAGEVALVVGELDHPDAQRREGVDPLRVASSAVVSWKL